MSHDSGASSFVRQLNDSLLELHLPSMDIALPSNYDSSKRYDIARVDGCYFYNFSRQNIRNYLELTRGWVPKLPLPSLSFLNAPMNYYLNRGVRGAIKVSKGIVFQSELSKAMHVRFIGQVQKPHRVIYNGARPICAPSSRGSASGEVWLAITASFRPHKRLLDALALLKYLNGLGLARFKLAVFGKVDSITKRYISDSHMEDITMYGAVSRNELVGHYMSKRPIGLSPALFDPCPNSVVEMMSCSLPVISTSASGAAELLEGAPEFVVPEDLCLTYLEQQTPERLPKIDIKKWAMRVIDVHRDYQQMSEKIYDAFRASLDIEVVAKKYSSFADSL